MTDPQVQPYWDNLLQKLHQSGLLNANGVEAAFSAIPRHLFLPQVSVEDAYKDRAIGLKSDSSGLLVSSASQPTMMAIQLNQLGLREGDNVLEIGTASGYNAALMRHIVGKNGSITTVELDKDLATQAENNLIKAGVRDIKVVQADGALGYAPRASYDAIIATVGVWDIPRAWLNQLKPSGRLVVPIVIDGVQVSAVFKPLSDGTFISVDNRPCSFVYLRGQNAGPNFRRQVGSSSLYLLADEVDKIDTIALHTLLSDDHAFCNFDTVLEAQDYWFGFQLYLMLNEPKNHVFTVYAVVEGQKAYGIEGRGVALFTRGSAALAGYQDRGTVHCFAGSDAFLEMQHVMDEWNAVGQPRKEDMRVRLTPKTMPYPDIERGKVYDRRDNYLHAWIEV